MCVQIPPAGSNVFDPWYPSYPLVEGVNSLGLIMNYCYPFLLCSLGPLRGEPMALVYYLTNRNKMLAASGRHPRLQKLKSSTSAPQRQPLRMNAAACFCNRIWRWTCLLTDHQNVPWNLLMPDFYLTINAAPLAQPWEAACEKWHDWLSLLTHLTRCTCVSSTTKSFQGILGMWHLF